MIMDSSGAVPPAIGLLGTFQVIHFHLTMPAAICIISDEAVAKDYMGGIAQSTFAEFISWVQHFPFLHTPLSAGEQYCSSAACCHLFK